MEANESILETAGDTERHKKKNESRIAKAANFAKKEIFDEKNISCTSPFLLYFLIELLFD